MFGALGNTWRHKFYMGTQNAMSLEKWSSRIFDSRLWIRDMAPKVFPYVWTGKSDMCICNDLHLYWHISQCLYREAIPAKSAM